MKSVWTVACSDEPNQPDRSNTLLTSETSAPVASSDEPNQDADDELHNCPLIFTISMII